MASLATGEDQVGPDNTDDEERASQVRDSGLWSSGAGGAHAPGETVIEIADTGFRDKNLKFDGLWEKLTLQPTKYTFYTIKVTFPNGKSYNVDRRYSEFYILHRLLSRKLPVLRNLDFPKKKLFFNLSKSNVSERRVKFASYLKRMMEITPRPFDFNRFLMLSENMPQAQNANQSWVCRNTLSGEDMPGADLSVDSFELLRVLGRGAFGKVFLVRKHSSEDIYAMKVLKKWEVTKRKQVEHTKTERRIMAATHHPFVVTLRYAFQTDDRLFFVTDYCSGGELFYHLRRLKRFDEQTVKFYSAEIYMGLAHLHDNNIVYRDLKPENVLLDEVGHVKITDFGLARDDMEDRDHGAKTFCGTPEYLSPEIIRARKLGGGYGVSVDWWGLGTMMYEMFTSWAPFYDRNIKVMLQKILVAPLEFPAALVISGNGKDIITKLLERSVDRRIGSNGNHKEIRDHPFYASIDFKKLYNRELTPPIKLEKDKVNVSSRINALPVVMTPQENANSQMNEANFENFTFSDSLALSASSALNQEDEFIDNWAHADEDGDQRIQSERKNYDQEEQRKDEETRKAIKEMEILSK